MQTAEPAVRDRYSAGALAREEALCCPVDYNPEFLAAIPAEVIERDYGCGDPSKYLRAGETVLDLGSGTGKICFIAAQVVGAEGRVIGIDMTEEMLELARSAAPVVAERIGYANVEFRRGRIQDLALDLDRMDAMLQGRSIVDAVSFLEAEDAARQLRGSDPMVGDNTIDVVVSNCVLNLVDSRSKPQLFAEIFRVLREGGRAVISDIVSDTDVPAEMQADPELWSGCVSGALTEDAFVEAFLDAGFDEVEILVRAEVPWRVVGGIAFRSVTVEAAKGEQEGCCGPVSGGCCG